MGKFPIIPRRDTRDIARRTSEEEEQQEERKATTTGAVIVGGAVSRSSAASSAIADSAAADRDRRLHSVVLRSEVDREPHRSSHLDTSSGGCTGRRRSAGDRPTDRTEPIGVIAGASGDPAYRRCRDVVVGATRPRRNTWHADRPEGGSSGVEVASSIGAAARPDDVGDRDVEEKRALGARRWNARIAGDDDLTCCATTDVTSPQARRPHDRANRAGPNSSGRLVERRARRGAAGACCLARSRSTGAPIDIPENEQILRSTVDSITIVASAEEERQGRNRFSANVPGYDGKFLSKGTVSEASEHADVSSSSSLISVFESRGPIGNGDVDTARVGGSSVGESSVHRSGPAARLVEIGIADSTCSTRSRRLAEEAADGTTSSSSLGKTIARLVPDESRPRRTKTDTCWRLPAARIGFVVRTLLLGLLVKSLLCDAVLAAPSSASFDLDSSVVFEDERELVMPGNDLRESELEVIRRSIVQGLGLQRIPDASKVSLTFLRCYPSR